LLRSALEPRFFSSNGALLLQAASAQQQNQQLHVISPPTVGNWLLLSSVLVLAVIVVGVVTRLTETEPRLSITEWRPITGFFLQMRVKGWLGMRERSIMMNCCVVE
jgi:cytochrome c oxidase assembly protein subunit 15